MRSANDYLQMLKKLLPRGLIWKAENGSTMQNFLHAHAEELSRIDYEAYRLISELNPSSTLEALEDWERVLGLPDECLGDDQSIEQRRRMVLIKLQRGIVYNKKYLVQLAKDLGYPDASVQEFDVFQVENSTVEERLNDADSEAVKYFAWRYVFLLQLGQSQIREFTVEESVVGERLREWGDRVIECIVTRDRPAHLAPLFSYDDDLNNI